MTQNPDFKVSAKFKESQKKFEKEVLSFIDRVERVTEIISEKMSAISFNNFPSMQFSENFFPYLHLAKHLQFFHILILFFSLPHLQLPNHVLQQ